MPYSQQLHLIPIFQIMDPYKSRLPAYKLNYLVMELKSCLVSYILDHHGNIPC